MSPFAIFAIVLTIAYIIYYGVNISRDLYGKKGQENETEETFDVSNMSEIEEPVPVTEDGDGFVIGAQTDLEKPSEVNLPEEQRDEEKKNDDSSRNEAAEKSKAEERVENIRKNMLEGDVQSEVVMDEKQFEDYLINQQVILFDNQRQNKGLKEVKASGNGKSENNESEIRWKNQCVLTPYAKTGLTPENYLILTPKYPDKWGHFYFSKPSLGDTLLFFLFLIDILFIHGNDR